MSQSHGPKLGLRPQNGDGRDAVHIAIVPIIAGDSIEPGNHVSLNPDGTAEGHYQQDGNDTIGIADPFFGKTIRRGQPFWLCLYPGSITDLRHAWSHPAFPSQDDTVISIKSAADGVQDAAKRLSIKYIEVFADNISVTYDHLMAAAETMHKQGQYTSNGDNEEYSNLSSGEWTEFWEHWQMVTGKTVDEDKKRSGFFSCAC